LPAAPALAGVEQAHHAELAVEAALHLHLAFAHAAHGLGQHRPAQPVQLLQGDLAQQVELRPQLREQLVQGPAHALGGRAPL
jgi:hypothetical protein